MAIITKIEVQKKNPNRVNLYVNDEFFSGLDLEFLYTLKLDKGSEVDGDKLKDIVFKDNVSKAKNKALRILNKAEQSEKILRDKLSDYEEDVIDEVINYLKECKFLDDKGFAQRMANDNTTFSRFGRNKIKQNLYKKGFDKDIIQDIISNIDEDEELENALYLARKKYKSIKNQDNRKVYQKLIQHLTYKGFSYDISKKAINSVLNSLDEIDEYEEY